MRLLKFLFVIPLISLGFSVYESNEIDRQAAAHVHRFYVQNLLNFRKAITRLKESELRGLSEEQLKREFLRTRENFKKIEFLLVYVDNKESKQINGANVVVNNYTYLTPYDDIQPHGLQVIESLIFNPTETSRSELKSEINLLESLIETIYQRTKKQQITDPTSYNVIVWDAIRYELFRIETLGITGFDVPDSENSLPESMISLRALHEVISIYTPQFKQLHNQSALKEGNVLFEKAIRFVQPELHTFESFDRLTFLKFYLHPLEKWVMQSIHELGYTYPQEVRPVSATASFVFSENFFNPNYFNTKLDSNRIKIGERLFYDTRLSSDGSRSCASCHQPEKAFTDGLETAFSLRNGASLQRNTPTLLNAAYQTKQFYDSRVTNLEKQAWDVIHNQHEMGGNLATITAALQQDSSYVNAFQVAYPRGTINTTNFLNAIVAYVSSLSSFDSPIDLYFRDEQAELSALEKQGFNLFTGKAKCATCHFLPVFNGLVPPYYTDTESEIIGVPRTREKPDSIDSDLGRFQFTRLELHRFAFKTSTVRNSALTAPYMHNGVFQTLDQVLDFYNSGGGAGQGMKLESQTLPADSLRLSTHEMSALRAFLEALTDRRYVKRK